MMVSPVSTSTAGSAETVDRFAARAVQFVQRHQRRLPQKVTRDVGNRHNVPHLKANDCAQAVNRARYRLDRDPLY